MGIKHRAEANNEMEVRQVKLEGAYNFRDVGGLTNKEGKRVRTGLLYRSDELCYCSPSDVEILEGLGLRSIIDFRNEKERTEKPDVPIKGVTVYALDPKADIAAMAASDEIPNMGPEGGQPSAAGVRALMVEQNRQFVLAEDSKKAYRAMFDLILDESKLPLDQHCRGGKDRTGYGVALILLLLGVDRETVIEDYMLTNVCKHEKNERSLKKTWDETHDEDLVQALRYAKEAQPEFLSTALDEIEEGYGTAENYVREELDMTDDQIQKLRKMFLED